MDNNSAETKYNQYIKLIFIAAFVLIGLWFVNQVLPVLFMFFFAIVLTLILNAPVTWLVSKKVPRTGAALLVFLVMLVFLFFIGWLVIPRILEQASSLLANLPSYYDDLKGQISSQLDGYPSLQDKLMDGSVIEDNLPSPVNVVTSIGRFSFSLIGAVFFFVVFLSLVIYMLINPAPLIETYLTLFPREKRGKAAHALARASTMMVGWMWSNLLVGSMEAAAVYFFLTFMDVPGVWVWVGLALFAEMVPKLGLYIMAVPPVLISLSIDPMTALWVLVFYLVLNEIMGDFVMPRVRASTMNLHPVSSLFVMIVIASAFGLIGALIATPLTAFIKAYYEEFYLSKTTKEHIDEQVETVLQRKA